MSTILENHDFVTIPGLLLLSMFYCGCFIFLLFSIVHLFTVVLQQIALLNQKSMSGAVHMNTDIKFTLSIRTLLLILIKISFENRFRSFRALLFNVNVHVYVHEFSMWKMFKWQDIRTVHVKLCFQSHSTSIPTIIHKMMGLAHFRLIINNNNNR